MYNITINFDMFHQNKDLTVYALTFERVFEVLCAFEKEGYGIHKVLVSLV